MGRSLNSGTLTTNGAGGATSSVVSITGTDAFTKGDPVFLDYSSGEVIKMNDVPAAAALAAGSTVVFPVVSPLTTPTRGSTVLSLGDGSHIVFSNTWSSGASQGRFEVFKYSDQSRLLNATTVETFSGSHNCEVIATLLSTGNIGVVYSRASNSLGWCILSPNTSILYSGTISVTSPNLFAIQATNEGGFVACGGYGIYRVTGTGVKSDIATNGGVNMTVAEVLTAGHDSSVRNRPEVSLKPNTSFFPISSGGYGLFYYFSNQVTYQRINADGSARGSTSVFTLSSGNRLRVAVATGGNILWLYSRGGNTSQWGIVADDGTAVLAGAALSDCNTSYPNSDACVADGNNCFLLTWMNAAGTALNINYVSATGTAKSTWPKTKTIHAARSRVVIGKTAGSLTVFSTIDNDYQIAYTSTDSSGTVLANNVRLPLIGATSGNGVDTCLSIVSSGGDLYGFYGSSLVSTGAVSSTVFKVNGTTGVATSNTSADLLVSVFESSCFATSTEIVVCDAHFFRIYEKSTLTLKNTYQASCNVTESYPIKYALASKGIRLFSSYFFLASSSNADAVFAVVKPYKTILLGVASTTSTAGGTVTIDTKGVFRTTWNAAQTYDQSGNNPIGNKGSTAGSVMTCLGLGI